MSAMTSWWLICIVPIGVGLYFFVGTRMSLWYNGRILKVAPSTAHIYALYRYPRLIALTDRQWVANMVLLGNYSTLQEAVLSELGDLKEASVLMDACSFGSFPEGLAKRAGKDGAKRVVFLDLLESELAHVKGKIDRRVPEHASLCSYRQGDAIALPFESGSLDTVVMFFLFHELPQGAKRKALAEALRVLKRGGTFAFADFHRPANAPLRLGARIYFSVFEPYAKEMFEFDPAAIAMADPGHHYEVKKKCFFGGNYQMMVIKKVS